MLEAEHQLMLSKAEMKSCSIHQLWILQIDKYRKLHTEHLICIKTIGEDLRIHVTSALRRTAIVLRRKNESASHQRNHDEQIVHAIFGSRHLPCHKPEYHGDRRGNGHDN